MTRRLPSRQRTRQTCRPAWRQLPSCRRQVWLLLPVGPWTYPSPLPPSLSQRPCSSGQSCDYRRKSHRPTPSFPPRPSWQLPVRLSSWYLPPKLASLWPGQLPPCYRQYQHYWQQRWYCPLPCSCPKNQNWRRRRQRPWPCQEMTWLETHHHPHRQQHPPTCPERTISHADPRPSATWASNLSSLCRQVRRSDRPSWPCPACPWRELSFPGTCWPRLVRGEERGDVRGEVGASTSMLAPSSSLAAESRLAAAALRRPMARSTLSKMAQDVLGQVDAKWRYRQSNPDKRPASRRSCSKTSSEKMRGR